MSISHKHVILIQIDLFNKWVIQVRSYYLFFKHIIVEVNDFDTINKRIETNIICKHNSHPNLKFKNAIKICTNQHMHCPFKILICYYIYIVKNYIFKF